MQIPVPNLPLPEPHPSIQVDVLSVIPSARLIKNSSQGLWAELASDSSMVRVSFRIRARPTFRVNGLGFRVKFVSRKGKGIEIMNWLISETFNVIRLLA